MSLGSIVVRLSMQTADFETDAGRAAKAAQRRAKEIDDAFSKAGKAIGVALGAGLLIGGAAFRKYIGNTIEAEKVQAQLTSRIKDTGAAAGRTLEQLNEQADKLQSLTVFDDEAIGGAQAMLLTFKQIQGVQFDRTIEAALDLATVMGTDAGDAAKLLGKALADPEKGMSALARAGVVFTEAEREAIKAMVDAGDAAKAQDTILDKLGGTMGTAAEAARNTLGGAIDGLKNAFDNLLEGDSGSDGLRGTVGAVNELSGTLNDPSIKAGIDTMAGGLLEIAVAAAKAVAWLGNAAGAVADYYGETAKQSRNVLNNRRTELETEMFRLQRSSSNSLANANDPIGKLFGLGSGKEGKLAKVKAEIAEIDRALKSLQAPAPRTRFTPEYDAASLNFDPTPDKPTSSPRSSGGGRSVTRAPALPNFLAEDQDALRRMVEQTAAANEQFERMAATLGGPLASAEYEHQQNLEQIAALGLQAERSSTEIIALKEAETQRYNDQIAAIEASLNPMQQLLDSYQEEIDMIGLSNAEKSMMNALREKGIDLAGKEGQAYMKAARAADAERKSLQDALGDQVQFMDAFRDGAADALTDFALGAKSAEDALKDFGRSMAALVTRMIAENWIEQLFGPKGSPGGGSAGGWLASFAGMLFGAGSGKASGGYTGAGGVHEPAGIVHRGEVVWSQGDVARAGGVSTVERMRRGAGGSSSSSRVTTPIVVLGDRAVADALATTAGRDVVITHVMANIDKIRAAL